MSASLGRDLTPRQFPKTECFYVKLLCPSVFTSHSKVHFRQQYFTSYCKGGNLTKSHATEVPRTPLLGNLVNRGSGSPLALGASFMTSSFCSAVPLPGVASPICALGSGPWWRTL